MAKITLAHGNGGLFMRELVDNVFAKRLTNSFLNTEKDAAYLHLDGGNWSMTTDGFTVQPLFFPGGDIGSLAIHGTVNDLSVSGATPKYLSLNAIIEEGLEFSDLEKIVDSMASAAKQANINIVTGDTKVVPKGHGGGVYFATTGIGKRIEQLQLDESKIKADDAILVSGAIGNHGIAVMMAREAFGLRSDIVSDSANIWPLVNILCKLQQPDKVTLLRDPTRGGLNMVVQDWNRISTLGVDLFEESLPIQPAVQSVCDMLGYDPFNLACEGRVVAIVDSTIAEETLALWKQCDNGKGAAIIGRFTKNHQRVVMHTSIGGQRVLNPLEDEPLPRIC
ncbi:hydrogenase expression/formation protein HypE [Teredinibacter haidensis]|uniref:hydrogenase expression/formation protein HypE n=1 Tax=Teredinibacter haidensis TaxID=2731755 RepID=UPI00094908FB|nr:hydrogenase expression/formation protein HypE [Teredinibacter haidensis]